jgi:hypothetical protein
MQSGEQQQPLSMRTLRLLAHLSDPLKLAARGRMAGRSARIAALFRRGA